ncbi:MAG: acetyl-CoA hydrolase/transferase C-terminal domain-containing protein [Desulfobacterales bacterium]
MERRPLDLKDWQTQYDRKLISLEAAAEVVQSGDHVFLPNGYSGEMPHAIVARSEALRDVKVSICAPGFDPGWLSEGMGESFDITTQVFLNLARAGHDEGRIQFLPYTVGTYFKPYTDDFREKRPIDVFLMEVSPPDENGFCSFGWVAWEKRNYAKAAKTIIAEIDNHHIRSRGDTDIHISEIDYLVDISAPPLAEDEADPLIIKFPPEEQNHIRQIIQMRNPRGLRKAIAMAEDLEVSALEIAWQLEEPTDVARTIAGHLKTLLRDRDTIQIGVGKPSKYMVELGVFDDLKDLGIFSEMACPGMGFLVKRGIATGEYTSVHPGKAVFAGLLGMRETEVRWANDNPLIELHRADYVVNIANIARHRNMVSINNVLQVDLTGQLTCETQFGPRLINGPGGQIEFHIGAFSAPGGRAISLLPSTWADGGVSTIVPHLEEGSLVSIPRVFADYVITEWGIAQLAGRTHRERAKALIQIAHPDFRDALEDAAKDIH